MGYVMTVVIDPPQSQALDVIPMLMTRAIYTAINSPGEKAQCGRHFLKAALSAVKTASPAIAGAISESRAPAIPAVQQFHTLKNTAAGTRTTIRTTARARMPRILCSASTRVLVQSLSR